MCHFDIHSHNSNVNFNLIHNLKFGCYKGCKLFFIMYLIICRILYNFTIVDIKPIAYILRL